MNNNREQQIKMIASKFTGNNTTKKYQSKTPSTNNRNIDTNHRDSNKDRETERGRNSDSISPIQKKTLNELNQQDQKKNIPILSRNIPSVARSQKETSLLDDSISKKSLSSQELTDVKTNHYTVSKEDQKNEKEREYSEENYSQRPSYDSPNESQVFNINPPKNSTSERKKKDDEVVDYFGNISDDRKKTNEKQQSSQPSSYSKDKSISTTRKSERLPERLRLDDKEDSKKAPKNRESIQRLPKEKKSSDENSFPDTLPKIFPEEITSFQNSSWDELQNNSIINEHIKEKNEKIDESQKNPINEDDEVAKDLLSLSESQKKRKRTNEVKKSPKSRRANISEPTSDKKTISDKKSSGDKKSQIKKPTAPKRTKKENSSIKKKGQEEEDEKENDTNLNETNKRNSKKEKEKIKDEDDVEMQTTLHLDQKIQKKKVAIKKEKKNEQNFSNFLTECPEIDLSKILRKWITNDMTDIKNGDFFQISCFNNDSNKLKNFCSEDYENIKKVCKINSKMFTMKNFRILILYIVSHFCVDINQIFRTSEGVFDFDRYLVERFNEIQLISDSMNVN